MDKNDFAKTPPMGWNSYDYYDTSVNEEQVRANADVMAARLKPFGWRYIVVDIEWYAHNAGTQRDQYQYLPFGNLEMDGYSRLLPCPERFPSSAGGRGFRPLADYIHSLGLKFGIHIMRGIPRIAAHNHGKIWGSEATADEIADPASICFWNPDMYGLRPGVPGAQEYYDSLFGLYAGWGVDFVKCDDICRYDMQSARREIEMLYRSIQRCGRPIVLSLSPGPAVVNDSWHYRKYANMWRITDDFWDSWPLLLKMFEKCEQWQDHVSEGCFPDCDMLPLGVIGKGFREERRTKFTKPEQITMMTLWCVFRSPLMLGSELTKLGAWTESLITNPKVLRLLSFSGGAKQIRRDDREAVWESKDTETGACYLAVFNLSDITRKIQVLPEEIQWNDFTGKEFEELWSGEKVHWNCVAFETEIQAHGAKLFKIQ